MGSPTINQVNEYIVARFINAWSDSTVYTLDGETFIGPNDVPWVRLSVREMPGSQNTLGQPGNRKYERKGLILGQIFTPIKIGTQQADTLAQAFKDIFEGVTFNAVEGHDATIRRLGTDGLLYSIVVEINFVYYETK